ncbi:adenine methyltransferase [Lactococcus muris]|uniref:adenine methyltransferase n=1 Tax=Lactococcus muris TaxID=2941330 RepID=UPI00373FD267
MYIVLLYVHEILDEEKAMLYNQTAQHSTAQHSTAQHSTAQHSTAQHSTAQHINTR